MVVVMELSCGAFLLLCGLIVAQSVTYETNSYASVSFNWSSDCNSIHFLNCTAGLEEADIDINGFTPRQASLFSCFFKVFGFAGSTNYNCVLGNTDGFLETIVVRTLSEAPSEPQNLRVYDITWSSAELDWDPPAVNWDRVAGYNIYTSAGSFLNTTTSTYIMLNLVRSTFYVIRVAATYYNSSRGVSADGPYASVSITTPRDGPTNLRRISVTSSSCFFIWSPPSTNADLITSYYIGGSITEVNTGSSNTYYNVTGLRASRFYSISVGGLTSLGTRTLATSSSCSTSSTSTVPSVPRNVRTHAGAATTTSCFITWSPPATNSHLVTGYRIRAAFSRTVGITTYYNFTGLSPGRSYGVDVSAFYNANNSLTSRVYDYTCRTKKLVTQPIQPTLRTLTSSSRLQGVATIEWYHSSSSSSTYDYTPSHFDVIVSPVHDLSGSVVPLTKTVAGNLMNTTITGLEANTSYQVTISARNSAGSSNAVSGIIPSYLPASSPEVVATRENYIQLLLFLSGNSNCSTWTNNININILSSALFDRLKLICPSCQDFLPRSNYLTMYTTHCSARSDLVLFQAKVTAFASCSGGCNFNTLLEHLVSLSSAYILASGSTFLIASSCPLYVSSLAKTDCLKSFSSSSSSSVAGAAVGGIFAGAVLASVIAAIVIVLLVIYCRRKYESMEKEELPPHPMSHTYHGKEATTAIVNDDDDYYEDIPMFDRQPKNGSKNNDDNYEDPSHLNIPKALSVSTGYEIPDCTPQIIPKKGRATKKERNKSKNLKDKKGKKVSAATVPAVEGDIVLDAEKDSTEPRKKGRKIDYIRTVDSSRNVPQPGKKEGRETENTNSQSNMYSHGPASPKPEKPPPTTTGQVKKAPIMPAQGKKLLVPVLSAGVAGGQGEAFPAVKPKPKAKEKPITLKENEAYRSHVYN